MRTAGLICLGVAVAVGGTALAADPPTANDVVQDIQAVPWSVYLIPTLVVVLAAVLLGLSLLRRGRR